MRNIKFELKEKSRANTVWLLLEYMGGDADTEHFEEHKYSFPYSEWQDNVDEIKKDFDQFSIIKKLTNGSGGYQDYDYEEIEKEYGEDIARLYDNVPNDPQSDFQFKTSLQEISLVGYDSEGNKFTSYL